MSYQRHPRPILRKLSQRVLTSKEPYPDKSEILFDDLEGIVVPWNYVGHSFDQVSIDIATFYLAAHFRLATLSSDRRRKKAAQNKWPRCCNLLIKHQSVPYCIRRRAEIAAGRNRSRAFASTSGFDVGRWLYFPAFVRMQRILLHSLHRHEVRSFMSAL